MIRAVYDQLIALRIKLLKQIMQPSDWPSDATPQKYALSLVVCEFRGLTGAVHCD